MAKANSTEVAGTESDAVKAFKAEAAAEEELARKGFEPFTWLNDAAEARHGPAMSEAFNLARDFLHGNAALLELYEDQDLCPSNRPFGNGRKGDFLRFLVSANRLAGVRIGELCDRVNEDAAKSRDFEARR